MSDTQKRDAVLEEFAHDAGVHRVWGVAGMAEEIVFVRDERDRLRDENDRLSRLLTAMRGSRDVVRDRLGDVEAERNLMYTVLDDIRKEFGVSESAMWFLRNNAKVLIQDLRSAVRRAERAERILDKLRHPRETVLHATNAKFPFEASMIMAAVKAAEQEVGDE